MSILPCLALEGGAFVQILSPKSQVWKVLPQWQDLLPTLDQPPPELHNLLTSQDPRAKGFCTNIRKYNDALAMTSVGHDLLPMEGGGPYVFKVHGSLTHHASSLLPAPN